jgi:hypothetical protein
VCARSRRGAMLNGKVVNGKVINGGPNRPA